MVSTSPIIRARNAQYRNNQIKRIISKNPSTTIKLSRTERRRAKLTQRTYMIAILLIMMSGGAIFEILKLFGVGK
ncbi:hypothetical protein BX616_009144 [Lobosporangium transversale]|nr:hypothetical protein BX616_009144 [Lobosporangium transversale]